MIRANWKISQDNFTALFKIIFANWWRLKVPLVFSIVLTPIIIYVAMLVGQVLNPYVSNSVPALMRDRFISAVLVSVLPIVLNVMPTTIVSFRNSILSEKICVSPITKIQYLLSNFVFYYLVVLLTVIWDFLITMLIQCRHFTQVFGNSNGMHVNWGALIIVMQYCIFMYVTIGICISLIFKTDIATQCFSALIYVAAAMFSGILVPLLIINDNQILKVLSYIFPFRYTTGLLQMSWSATNNGDNGGIFYPWLDYSLPTVGSAWNIVVLNSYDIWLCWFMPMVYIGSFIGLSRLCFKWKM